MTAAPNLIPFQPLAVTEWIKIAISNPTLPPTSTVHLNGYSDNAMVKEAIESLAVAHNQGGMKGAKVAWDEHIAKAIPEIAEIVNRPRRIIHADELRNRKPLPWLIIGEVPDRAVTVVFGAPEVGKSFYVLDCAERLAQRVPVLYIAAEGTYDQRHAAWMKHNEKETTQLHFIEEPIMLLSPGETDNLIEEAREIHPRLVIFDTLSQCFIGGEENSNTDMSRFIVECRKIVRQLQCAVILVHHIGKAGGERGASALRGNVDAMIEVDNDDDVIRIIPSKLKDSKKGESRKLRRVTVQLDGDVTSCVLMPAHQVIQKENDLTPNQRIILELLSGHSFDKGARSSDLQKYSNVNGSTFYRTVESLARRSLIYKEGKFDPWCITPTGRKLANQLGLTKLS